MLYAQNSENIEDNVIMAATKRRAAPGGDADASYEWMPILARAYYFDQSEVEEP